MPKNLSIMLLINAQILTYAHKYSSTIDFDMDLIARIFNGED